MSEWKKCRKKPIVVEFREVEPTNTTAKGKRYKYYDLDGGCYNMIVLGSVRG